MFRNNMIVSIKSNSKFLKEDGEHVRLPFGSEYSIYMKNQNETDALVSITIDGQDVLSGNKIILRSKSVLDLEGFLDGGQVRNKFRFIERTDRIDERRGVRPDDGIISISFTYEKEKPKYQPYVVYYPYQTLKWEYVPYTITTTGSSNSGGVSYTTNHVFLSNYVSNSINENGITVEGNRTSQNFGYGWLGEMEDVSTTMSLKLLGLNNETEKIYTSDLHSCKICGYKSKKNFNFCPECGAKK